MAVKAESGEGRGPIQPDTVISLQQCEWQIVDDAAWTKDWVGLSRGDIHRGGQPFGHYVAAWYPNTDKPMSMIVTLCDDMLNAVLSIGVRCPRGALASLVAVEPEEIPWESDGLLFGPMARPGEFDVHSRAGEALLVAPEIVLLDASLRKYICEPERSITES